MRKEKTSSKYVGNDLKREREKERKREKFVNVTVIISVLFVRVSVH